MDHQYTVLLCVWFFLFSLYSPGLVWFFQNKGVTGASGRPVVTGLREAALRLRQDRGCCGETHRRLDTFHWPRAAVCSWLAFPPAHHREHSWPSSPQEMMEQPGCPHRAFHWNMLPPESPLHLPPSPLWPIRWPDANEWLFWSQWEPQPERLLQWSQL